MAMSEGRLVLTPISVAARALPDGTRVTKVAKLHTANGWWP
jgi:hypothetical protein